MMLEQIARWCYAFRWPVVVGWVLALTAGVVLMVFVGGEFAPDSSSFRLPGTESQQAVDLLEKRFPAEAGDTSTIVFKAEHGVMGSEVKQRIGRLLEDVAGIDHVARVESPYRPDAHAISSDQTIARATVMFDAGGSDLPAAVGAQIMDVIERSRVPGLEVEFASQLEQFGEGPAPGSAGREVVALLAAAIVLLITFGTAIAAGLPLVTAGFSSSIGIAVIFLLARVVALESATIQLAMMVGLGAGIDYALLIVTRYREGLDAGLEPAEAAATAIPTAGRAALFAGSTVVISLAGIFLMGLQFLQNMALGVILVVLLIMLASVTLLPALLGVVGRGVNRLRLPVFGGSGGAGAGSSPWLRWSHVVQRHPLPAAVLALLMLIALGIPVFSMRLGFADAETEGASGTGERAYELLGAGFGPGFNGPLVLAAELNSPTDENAIDHLTESLRSTDGVALVAAPAINPQRDAAAILVVPDFSPDDERTEELVHRLRVEVMPPALAGTDASVSVGGITAFFIDLSDVITRRLPLMIGAVIGVSFLLLMAMFRSLLVPLKAVVMNLLSVGAAYGVLVAVFQWGWLKSLVGVTTTGPIDAILPPMLFAILFGLSMDYEVFLLSRIQEEYRRTGDNRSAVADGLAATGRVITGAAAIMVTIFLAFVLMGDQRTIKMAGVGLATAIFVDATLVRMVLVPALMDLLGDANWWFPRWLDRIVPRLGGRPRSGVGGKQGTLDGQASESTRSA